MASTYLTRTPSSAGNLKTFTISAWIKRADISTTLGTLLLCSYTSSSNYTNFYIGSGDKLTVNSSGTGSSCFIETNRLFRDASAWYHIVIAVDTTEGTASDRVKIYVNGVRETSFASTTYFGSSVNTLINSTVSTNINRNQYGTAQGSSSMSHFHLIDGTAYDPTAFGEYDANGVWKIIASPSVTYGTNGFFILKNGNSVTDQSGNSNNFTVAGGTLTNTEDSPSNVFATLNPLATGSLITLANGNLKATGNSASDSSTTTATIGITSGKFYWEAKIVNVVSGYPYLGIYEDFDSLVQDNLQGQANGTRVMTVYVVGGGTTLFKPGTDLTITAPTTNDIIMFAVDKVNNKFYMGVNGSWYNSGNPTSGATGTGSLADLDANGVVMFGSHNYNASAIDCNLGNGYFGTTAVSSAGTNASGIGIFEYDVPTGYTALSTKGLNL